MTSPGQMILDRNRKIRDLSVRLAIAETQVVGITEKQIKHMVDRFLNWKLPENFNPDGGISFEKVGNKGTAHEYKHQPCGTNLFDAKQAEAMVRYMIEGISAPPAITAIVEAKIKEGEQDAD